MKLLRLMLPVLVLSALAAPARADYAFQFADAVGTPTTSFTVDSGSTVAIRVYLVQSGSDTGLTSPGLNTGGVGVVFGNTAAARVLTPGNITPNPAFDSGSGALGAFSGTQTVARVAVFQDVGGVQAPATGADANRVLLGTFTFTGVTVGQSSTFTIDPTPSPFNDNVLASGVGIDALITSGQTATIAVVPEPGSLALAALLAIGTTAAARRQRRRATA